mgnify:CR=1 FL=1
MTVRIAQEIGIDKIANFAKSLKIYDNPEELLSISLGSAETTLLKLTSAYSSFVNGGKLVEPIFLDRIQDSAGSTIYNSERRTCEKCWRMRNRSWRAAKRRSASRFQEWLLAPLGGLAAQ